jgi:hypothetical protein
VTGSRVVAAIAGLLVTALVLSNIVAVEIVDVWSHELDVHDVDTDFDPLAFRLAPARWSMGNRGCGPVDCRSGTSYRRSRAASTRSTSAGVL